MMNRVRGRASGGSALSFRRHGKAPSYRSCRAVPGHPHASGSSSRLRIRMLRKATQHFGPEECIFSAPLPFRRAVRARALSATSRAHARIISEGSPPLAELACVAPQVVRVHHLAVIVAEESYAADAVDRQRGLWRGGCYTGAETDPKGDACG